MSGVILLVIFHSPMHLIEVILDDLFTFGGDKITAIKSARESSAHVLIFKVICQFML